jgi:hypothetical protein
MYKKHIKNIKMTQENKTQREDENTPLIYNDLSFPNYRNSREIYAGLTASDFIRAAVISGTNFLLTGDSGNGKTQLTSDLYNYLFGGNIREGGQGAFMRIHKDFDFYNDVLTKLDPIQLKKVLTGIQNASVFIADEFNRAPAIGQNQLLGLGDGRLDNAGEVIPIGQDGYHLFIGTANIGNGDFKGAFESDKAFYNRNLVFNLDDDFEPTPKDRAYLDFLGEADPNIKPSDARDISSKLREKSREIRRKSGSMNLESLAAVRFIAESTRNCREVGHKGTSWPISCKDCPIYNDGNALCSQIKNPTGRPIEMLKQYATALYELGRMKDSNFDVDPAELVFKAAEFVMPYKGILNPSLTRGRPELEPLKVKQVLGLLKERFNENRDFIVSAYEQARQGKNVTQFFNINGEFGNYEDVPAEYKEGLVPIVPFNDDKEMGLSYVKSDLEVLSESSKESKVEGLIK